MSKYLNLLFGMVCIFYAGIGIAEIRDPTQATLPSSTAFSNTSKEGLELNAILYSAAHPVVIIGGNIFHLNDTIGEYKITAIQRQAVQLTSDKGETLNLQVETLDVKKPHIAK